MIPPSGTNKEPSKLDLVSEGIIRYPFLNEWRATNAYKLRGRYPKFTMYFPKMGGGILKFFVGNNFKLVIKELSQKVIRNTSLELEIIKQFKEVCST